LVAKPTSDSLIDMIQEWNGIEFKFGNQSDVVDQIAIADYGSRISLVDLLKTRGGAKEEMSAQLKKFKKEDDSTDPKTGLRLLQRLRATVLKCLVKNQTIRKN
jgi:hypothetical protein